LNSFPIAFAKSASGFQTAGFCPPQGEADDPSGKRGGTRADAGKGVPASEGFEELNCRTLHPTTQARETQTNADRRKTIGNSTNLDMSICKSSSRESDYQNKAIQNNIPKESFVNVLESKIISNLLIFSFCFVSTTALACGASKANSTLQPTHTGAYLNSIAAVTDKSAETKTLVKLREQVLKKRKSLASGQK
jgi:hypothetical protein